MSHVEKHGEDMTFVADKALFHPLQCIIVTAIDRSPSFRPHHSRRPTIDRPRLIQKLNQGLGEKISAGAFATQLTVVTGPAGFGKTTLVSDWLTTVATNADGLAIGWLALSPSHDEPVRFGADLLATVSSLFPTVGVVADRTLPLHSMLNILFRLLDETSRPAILVIDDFHLICRREIHEALNDLIAHLPPTLHLVVVSRADPPLPLSRLRVGRAITEIRARDLRFTLEEAAQFMQTIMGLDLTMEEVAILDKRTEGWVAGLQLAAHSLQLEDDRAHFLEAFAGDDRYVADYLLEEVLLRQAPDVQRFLLETSIINRLDPDLCNAVTGRTDSASVLAALEQANLFVVPLDTRRHVYRYHQLFSDLLKIRLLGSDLDERDLHRRATQWLAASGDTVEAAVEHALATGDSDYAADLITRVALSRFLTNELTLLVRWIERLPDETLRRRPRLCLAGGWAALLTGQPNLAQAYVAHFEEALGHRVADLGNVELLTPHDTAALIEAAAIRSRLLIGWFDAPGALALCSWALARAEQLPVELRQLIPEQMPADPENPPPYFYPPQSVMPVLYFNQGLAYSFDIRVDAASRALATAADLAQPLGNAHLVALALGHLAHVQHMQGQLMLAENTCERGLRLVEQTSGAMTPLAGILLAHQGNIAYERYQLAEAGRLWRQAIDLALPWENWEALLPAYIGLALVSRARGDWVSAHDALDTLLELTADQTGMTAPIVAAYRAWFLAEAGERHAALQWAESLLFTTRTNWAYLLDLENTCRVHLRLATGDYDLARDLSAELAESAAADGRWQRYIDSQVCHALALQGLGQTGAASEALELSLIKAGEEEATRAFIEAGPILIPLLQRVQSSAPAARMARNVLAAMPATERPPGGSLIDLGADGGLLENLTERELEVLQLVADGLSNRQIAETLYLTEGTVKNHAHSIYSKLDANGRTHAVARGRTLGLLTTA